MTGLFYIAFVVMLAGLLLVAGMSAVAAAICTLIDRAMDDDGGDR